MFYLSFYFFEMCTNHVLGASWGQMFAFHFSLFVGRLSCNCHFFAFCIKAKIPCFANSFVHQCSTGFDIIESMSGGINIFLVLDEIDVIHKEVPSLIHVTSGVDKLLKSKLKVFPMQNLQESTNSC
jgi:hypothetical protein